MNRTYRENAEALDAGVEEELTNILGIHQRMMAARREAALADATVSLFQRLMEPELQRLVEWGDIRWLRVL